MKKGTKKCPKCGGFFRPQGFPKHFVHCDGEKREAAPKNGKKGKKKCPHCGKYWFTKSGGWRRHVLACGKKHANPEPAGAGPINKRCPHCHNNFFVARGGYTKHVRACAKKHAKAAKSLDSYVKAEKPKEQAVAVTKKTETFTLTGDYIIKINGEITMSIKPRK